MLKTFFKELMTQSKTAFSLGTLLMVLRGRRTRRTLRDFITARFSAPELPLRANACQQENLHYRQLRHVHHEGGDDEDYYNNDDDDDDDDDDDSSRHIHDKGGEGTGDDDQVHAIPHLTHVRARVQDQAIV